MTHRFTTRPTADGFRMPAEFESHEGTILIWPVRPGSWPYGGQEAQKTFLDIAVNLAEGEKVFLCAKHEDYAAMQEAIREKITGMTGDAASCDESAHAALVEKNLCLMELSSDDSWARDIGPTVVVNDKGDRRGIDWQFNAWGGDYNGLYAEWQADNAFASTFMKAIRMDAVDAQDFVLEGGAIHVDGEGTLVVTETCLLSPGRNPSLSKENIEQRLKEMLGVTKVIWLPVGIYNDETDEHVDNVFAFTAPGEAVLAWTDDETDPQYEMSRRDLEVLERETDAKGRKIRVHKLRIPKKPVCISEYDLAGLTAEPGEDEREVGERLAASYANFYIGNTCVLVPAFGDEMDDPAAELLQSLFPDRKVVQIPARSIIVGGGNIHCITQQIPAGVPAGR